jgi:hypothetical protein
MGSYWGRVFARAWTGAASVIGIDKPAKFIFQSLAAALAVYLLINWGTEEAAASASQKLLYTAGATFALVPAITFAHLIIAPWKIHTELTAELTALRIERNAWNDRRAVGSRLEEMHRNGLSLFDVVNKDDAWRRDIRDWFAEVDGVASEGLPQDERFMLRTVQRIPEMAESGIDFERALIRKCQKLRNVIARCYAPLAPTEEDA